MATRKMECVRCKMPIVYEETQKLAICPRCGERNKTIHVRKKMAAKTKRLLKKIAIIALAVVVGGFALIGAIVPWLSGLIGGAFADSGNYDAAKFFLRLASSDGRARANELVLDYPKVGDSCILGTYERDNNLENGEEPLEWEVLSVEDGRALLITKEVIDASKYHPYSARLTWEDCDLRAYMNGEFYEDTFTAAEKERILLTNNVNADNVKYGTSGGNNTDDYVFPLSYDELKTYFEGESYFADPTPYAVDNALMVGYETGYAWWWLRSPGFTQDMAAVVATREADVALVEFGQGVDMLEVGTYVTNRRMGLRPALWVKTAE